MTKKYSGRGLSWQQWCEVVTGFQALADPKQETFEEVAE